MTAPRNHGAATTAVDVAIIGGGIAGSSLAITLRRQGMNVALVEREPQFRDRIRGEAMHPWGVREVDALGLRPLLDEAGAVELPLWTRYRNSVPGEPYAWTSDIPDSPPELSFGHPRLQETLIQAAIHEGVRLFRPARTTPVRVDGGWLLDIDADDGTHRVLAGMLVGADGKNSSTRTLIGAQGVRDPVHHHMGGALLKGVDLPSDSVHQSYFEGGIAVIFPQERDYARSYYIVQSSVARDLMGKGADGEYIRRLTTCFPDGDLNRVELTGPLGFFPNADVVVDRIAGENAVLIGDAAGVNDPTQGHGTSLLFRDIRVLRDLLASDPATALQAFEQYRRSTHLIVRTHAMWVAPLLIDTGDQADALREQVGRARELDPGAEGYANIYATSPDGLRTDDETRSRFFGEHLPDATVRSTPSGDHPGGLLQFLLE